MSKKLVSLSLLVALVFTLFPLAIMAAPITTVAEVTVAPVVTTTQTVTETQVTTATESVTKTEVAPVAKTEEVTTTTAATKTEEVAPVAKTESVTTTTAVTKTEEVAKTESVTKTEVAPASQGGGETYTIQKDDWLSKIAEKKYNDVMAYKAIVKYNNDKAAADKALAKIENPDVIEVGWTIYLPTADEVKAFMPTAAPVAPTAPVTETKVITNEMSAKFKGETTSKAVAPENGRSRIFLVNEYKDELTFTIGKEYKVPVGGIEKMLIVDLDAGKYTYTVSVPGSAVNGEVNMAPDQSWIVGVLADGTVYSIQIYPETSVAN